MRDKAQIRTDPALHAEQFITRRPRSVTRCDPAAWRTISGDA
ncbi:hypothetical protein [Parasphingopyxis algicola]|nr:hypothetical protein [Parasphingopyxis algicola]